MYTENIKSVYIAALGECWHKIMRGLKNSKDIADYEKILSLSDIEVGVVNIVWEKEDIILREVSEELKIPKSTLTSVIDRLEKNSYLRRTISKRDKRSYGLELTEEGKEIQIEHLKFEQKVYCKVLNALDSDNEREMFLKLLYKMTANLDKKA